VGFGCWSASQAVECVSQHSDNSSSDKLSDVAALSLPAEEIVPVKCRSSLPAEGCVPIKHRRASQRVQTPEREGKK